MKLKKVKIVVEPFKEVRKRWKAALEGGKRSKTNEEIISVGSWEVLGKILSAPRLKILSAISHLKPKSIAHLAKMLEKDFKNVHSDVTFLANLGFIFLKEKGNTRALIPIAKFYEIELPLAA